MNMQESAAVIFQFFTEKMMPFVKERLDLENKFKKLLTPQKTVILTTIKAIVKYWMYFSWRFWNYFNALATKSAWFPPDKFIPISEEFRFNSNRWLLDAFERAANACVKRLEAMDLRLFIRSTYAARHLKIQWSIWPKLCCCLEDAPDSCIVHSLWNSLKCLDAGLWKKH